MKKFTLKHNIYPYSIIYSYQVQQREFIYLDYWLPIIDIKVPTLKAVLNVEIPKDYEISYKSQYIDSFRMDPAEGIKKYTWETSYKNIITPEVFSPPAGNFLPTVEIVAREFNYDITGSFDSWQTFGNWQYNLIQELSYLPLSEKNKISEVTRNATSKKEKIRKLYHYLQDATRYINISIETGGLKPYPASYVAENKYGDCKALTNYFKSVLNIAGIRSYYTIVYAGSPIKKINKGFPSLQFNHVILCVPLQKDTLWLDCTSNGPFNYLGTFTQNRNAFIIKKDSSYFTRTPSMTKEEVLETRTVTLKPDNQNEAIVNFKNSYRGKNFDDLFYISRNYSESVKSQIIRNNFIEKGFNIVDYKLMHPGRDSSIIYLSYSARTNKIYKQYGNEILIALMPFTFPDFEMPDIRKLPVQLDYPIYKIDTLEYITPENYTISSLPENQSIQNEFGHYSIEFIPEKNKVKIIKKFLLNSGNFSDEKYRSFYAFLKNVEGIENNTYMITTNNDEK